MVIVYILVLGFAVLGLGILENRLAG